MGPPLFNWPPFKLVALDADTGKPIDPTVGMRVKREFYNVKKDKDGKKLIVVHKNGNGSSKAGVMTEDVKKGGGANGSKKDGKGSKKEEAKGNGGDEKKDNKDGAEQKPGEAAWTPEEDDKLKALKAEGKTWNQIADELGRPKGAIRGRFREIGGSNDGGAGAQKNDQANKKDGGCKKDKSGGNKGENKKEGQKEKNANKNTDKKPDQKPEKKDEDKRSTKAPSKAPSKPGSSGEARFTMGEWRTLQEDDMFSFGELQCLSELIMRDERQRWLRIASAFADTTGRRVHPDDIREKFEQIGRMG